MSNFHDTTWAEMEIASARSKANGKPLQNNTRLFANEDGSYRIRLHNTDIITINTDGTYTLAANGYTTVTTMDRLRTYAPVRSTLYSVSGEWFVLTEPNPKDPAPARVERTIPKPYMAFDPGPEPVKNDDGCQAGTMLGTDHIDEIVEVWRNAVLDTDEIVEDTYEVKGNYDRLKVKRTWTSWVFYGADAYEYYSKEWREAENKENTKYEQCPHCKAFDAEHEAWRLRMHGERWGRRFDQASGYAKHAEMMERFGSMEAWQEAYIADFRARREFLKEAKAWEERNRVPFFDGITVNGDGYAPRLRKDGPSPAKLRRHEKEVARVKKAIDKYVDGFMAALKEGMPMPSSGDCWYCSMKTDTGATLGDSVPTLYEDGTVKNQVNTDHLWSHFEDKYYVPSLITNAMLERGYKPLGVYMMLDMDQDAQTMGGRSSSYDGAKRDLRKYLQKRLIPQAPTK